MRTLHALVASLLLLMAVPSALSAERQISNRKFHEAIACCQRGDRALSEGDLSRASEQFEKALAIVPEFPEAYTGIGHIALIRRDYAAALNAYTHARDAYASISRRLTDHRLYEKGESQKEIQSRRDDITNLSKLLAGPELEMRVREIQREIDYFDRMDSPREDKRAKTPAAVYFFRGNALFHLDRLDEAIEDWKEAAALAPDFGPVYNNLAVAAWRLGRPDEAREYLSKAEALDVEVNPEFQHLVRGGSD